MQLFKTNIMCHIPIWKILQDILLTEKNNVEDKVNSIIPFHVNKKLYFLNISAYVVTENVLGV